MSNVIGFIGFSNSGKTTLIARLVEYFAQEGVRSAVIKHDAHGHYKEAEGSDSSKYINAGASAAVVVSPESYVMFRREAKNLEQMVSLLREQDYDLIFVEGFKHGRHDRIALIREAEQASILHDLQDPPIAVAGPPELAHLAPAHIPFLDMNDIGALAKWILARTAANGV
ncbi:molybdopterin-guanine dinucleotide biosynthesis protein B [Paenibacillus xerothermodurans]|nr:molybdopterin-guanine dinucleotide biosynthesis protein B [Paenibacillus xerothermodurans]